MKRLLLALVVICVITACKKSSTPPSANIVGKWELTRRYGGNIFPPDTTYKAGNGNIFQFNSDGTFEEYTNGSLTTSGTFHLNNGELYFNNDVTFDYMTSISGNLLTLKPLIPDISTTVYDKIQD